MGKKVGFVTNNSIYTRTEYEKKFASMGVELGQNELIHPAIATVRYLKRVKFEGLIFCIGSAGCKAQLKAAGYEYIEGPQEQVHSVEELAKKLLVRMAIFSRRKVQKLSRRGKLRPKTFQ